MRSVDRGKAVVQGGIVVNGKPMTSAFQRVIGYVMQSDALFPMLTVRETLFFSARLRLPQQMGHTEKKKRVDMLIEELGLQSCADTVIGNEQVRALSPVCSRDDVAAVASALRRQFADASEDVCLCLCL